MESKHTKIIIGLVIAVVVAVIVLLFVKAAKDKKEKEAADKLKAAATTGLTPTPTGLAPPAPAAPAAVAASEYPVRYNTYNADVKELQKALGFTGKDVDGKAGNNTIKALNDTLGTNYPASVMFYVADKKALIDIISRVQAAKKAGQSVVNNTIDNWNSNNPFNTTILMY